MRLRVTFFIHRSEEMIRAVFVALVRKYNLYN